MKNCLNSISEVLRRLNAGGECYKQKKNLCDLVLDDLYPYFLHNTLIYRYARHDIPSVSSVKICQKQQLSSNFKLRNDIFFIVKEKCSEIETEKFSVLKFLK